MIITEKLAVKKREVTSGTKEWADSNVNCIKGCSNNCRYCYARMMAKRFGRCNNGSWEKMVINQVAVEKKYIKYKGRVMFPSTHDITTEPYVKEACYIVIKKLLDAGNELLITTKPRLSIVEDIVRLFSLFKQNLQFRFTITSLDSKILAFWEPNAPSFEERFESLQYAYKNSFKTSVSIEPFLDNSPQKLVKVVFPYVTESIWVGPMNYMPRNGINKKDEKQYIETRKNYGIKNLWEIYHELKTFPKIRFKDSMFNRLGLIK